MGGRQLPQDRKIARLLENSCKHLPGGGHVSQDRKTARLLENYCKHLTGVDHHPKMLTILSSRVYDFCNRVQAATPLLQFVQPSVCAAHTYIYIYIRIMLVIALITSRLYLCEFIFNSSIFTICAIACVMQVCTYNAGY